MTFPFFQSSLNYEESELASLILDNFNLKRDFADFDFFKSLEVSKETDIELNILSIAIFCINRPNFISDEDAERIEQIFLKVIVWMARWNPQQFSTVREGQLYHARTKLDTYKKELQLCLSGEKGHIPLSIYSGIFHFPLQSEIVEEKDVVLEIMQDFNSFLKWLMSNYTEIVFKCFEELHPNPWYPDLSSKDFFQHLEKHLFTFKLFDYKNEKSKFYEKYKKLNSTDQLPN